MTISTEPRITIALKPHRRTDAGIAYTYMTADEAITFATNILVEAIGSKHR